ncbi:MAG: hypothetical protein HYU63_01555 [Armatimonadetes bacterium]|nr:hypothetical protein [Armatimonadota bacterium]
MPDFFCPGSDILKNAVPCEYPCPQCGYGVEIFSNEMKRKCPQCGFIIFRELDLGCAAWCKSAKECLGETLYKKVTQKKDI